ncbi:MAG: DUF4175 family protein [Myxococcota bacterium]
MSDRVEGYLRKLRRRALFAHGLRALGLGGAAGMVCFISAALLAGPSTGAPLAVALWTVVGLIAAGFAVRALWPVRRLRGSQSARLLRTIDPVLASRAQSAAELRPVPGPSAELIEAHQARVVRELETVPPQSAVPLRATLGRTGAAGFGIILLGGVLILVVDPIATGAFALTHPSITDLEGQPIAAVVRGVDVTLNFPAYLDRAPEQRNDAWEIRGPRGATVDLRVDPRIDAVSGVAVMGDEEVALAPTADGKLAGTLRLDVEGTLIFRLVDGDGESFTDPGRRPIRIDGDALPVVTIIEPEASRVVELDEEVAVSWEASDDVGLSTVELVVEVAGGTAVRRRLGHYEDARKASQGLERLSPAALGARRGDRITVVVEAFDNDDVSGPNRGQSEILVLEVASEATERAAEIGAVDRALELGLTALADRLEQPVPEAAEAASARLVLVTASGEAFTAALDQLEEGEGAGGRYRAMATALRREFARETRRYRPRVRPLSSRSEIDATIVETLEGQILSLADELSQLRLDDAAAIARELDALRREITSLLEEVRRTNSPEAREALLSAIGRAEARMQELMARIAAMGENVPSEFVNQDAMPTEEVQDALASMRDAVEGGDLDQAAAQLTEMQRQIDAMAQALAGGAESFGESRFGPREQALAEALDRLAGLEAEQQDLSRSSAEVRRNAAERALSADGTRAGEASERLVEQAQAAAELLDGIDESAPVDPDALARARQRLDDVADALRTGDLGEARRMADSAGRDVEQLSRDLDLSALMFPGARGQTGEAARAARQAERSVDALRDGIDQAIPQMRDFLDTGANAELQRNRERQEAVSEATRRLAEDIAEGPDGQPLFPNGTEALEQAGEAMEQAERALRRPDPVDASRAQRDAARQLTELREELERQQDQSQSGGGGGASGSDSQDFREDVLIPSADEFRGPQELRRRILDAMRRTAPEGYRDAVRRYYEGLLR